MKGVIVYGDNEQRKIVDLNAVPRIREDIEVGPGIVGEIYRILHAWHDDGTQYVFIYIR